MDAVGKDFVSGIAAGLANVACLSPLDTVRTRCMLSGRSSLRESLASIFRTEGLRGFYRAGSLSCVAFPASWSVYFSVYNLLNEQFSSAPSSWSKVFSSTLAGVTTTIVTNPIWLVRTRVQLQTETTGKYGGLVQGTRLIFKEEGATPFVRGTLVSLLGVINVSVQLPLYEYLKTLLGPDSLTTAQVFGCASFSKVVASLLTYPHEVLRAHIFVTGYSVKVAAQKLYDEAGFLGYYRGFGPNLLKIVPSSFITLCTYETVSSFLTK